MLPPAFSKGFVLLWPIERVCFVIQFRPNAFEWLRSGSDALRRCSFLPLCNETVDDDGAFRFLSVRSFGHISRSLAAFAIYWSKRQTFATVEFKLGL